MTSFFRPGLGTGSCGLYIGFEPSKLDAVRDGFRRVIAEVSDQPVSEEELTRAREYILGSFEVGLQRFEAQAADMAFNELYGLGHDYTRKYLDGITRVTAEAVQNAARRYLDLNQAVEVSVGPTPGAVPAEPPVLVD